MKRATDHFSIRLDADTVARLDALAPRIAPPGAKPVRAIATRACILAGLDVIEKQLDAAETP